MAKPGHGLCSINFGALFQVDGTIPSVSQTRNKAIFTTWICTSLCSYKTIFPRCPKSSVRSIMCRLVYVGVNGFLCGLDCIGRFWFSCICMRTRFPCLLWTLPYLPDLTRTNQNRSTGPDELTNYSHLGSSLWFSSLTFSETIIGSMVISVLHLNRENQIRWIHDRSYLSLYRLLLRTIT